jgi:carbon storage regulator
MEIVNVPFETRPLIIEIDGQKIECFVFETIEHGNIKFGVNAPRAMSIHREEVHRKINQDTAG